MNVVVGRVWSKSVIFGPVFQGDIMMRIKVRGGGGKREGDNYATMCETREVKEGENDVDYSWVVPSRAPLLKDNTVCQYDVTKSVVLCCWNYRTFGQMSTVCPFTHIEDQRRYSTELHNARAPLKRSEQRGRHDKQQHNNRHIIVICSSYSPYH